MQTLPTVDAPCALCGGDRAEPVWTTADRAFAVPGLYTVVRCRAWLELPRHLSHFTPETLERTVRKAGGRVVWCWHQAKPRYYLWSLSHVLRDHGWDSLVSVAESRPVYGALKLLLEVTLPLARRGGRGEVIRIGAMRA